MHNPICWLAGLLILLAVPAATHAQQRADFQRQKFDRSRFDRPGQSAAPAPAPVPLTAPAPSAPAPMATEPPAGEFSFSPPPAAAAEGAAAPDPAAPGDPAAAAPRPPSDIPPGASEAEKALIVAPKLDEIPTKWFTNPKDHDELLELQKQTGACILIYFKNLVNPQEKGLCSWFERGIATDIKWRKAMRHYLKLEITLPGNNAALELAAKYRAGRTPALFVLKPRSVPNRLTVFQFTPGQRPELQDIDTVLEWLKARSTVFYQSLF
jgi:hypothetical protein